MTAKNRHEIDFTMRYMEKQENFMKIDNLQYLTTNV